MAKSQYVEDDVQPVGSLEINQELNHQRSLWKAQPVGWEMLGLVILSALL